MADRDYSGKWQFCHWYPSKDDSEETSGTFDMVAHATNDGIVLESDANAGAYMFVRLGIEGDVASGSWHENADPKGEHSGVMYSGAGQLIISADGQTMDGVWAGVGFDHAANKPKVYTGRWQLKKIA
ncbi:MAG TPA: hypothetical protein VLF91_05150 [Candidatus Saccharimonadales bacterium]|nr:hypothetical protein [Candidatus Saccharimonadales bacterium]